MTNSAGSEARVATECFVVTPSDTVIFEIEAAGLYVGSTGNVTIKRRNGTTVLFSNVPAGYVLPVTCIGVMGTGTTATGIVGLA